MVKKYTNVYQSKGHLIRKIKFIRKLRKIGISISILLNVFLIAKMSNHERVIEREYYFNTTLIDKAYNLHNYSSISDSSSDMQERVDKLFNKYVTDKVLPKSAFYEKNNTVNAKWQTYCVNKVRRIYSIKTMVSVIDQTMTIMLAEKKDSLKYFELLQAKSAYDEKISEMSNFYAKFIANYTYDSIVKTID